MAAPFTAPEDLPLFDVSTHDLYALAHGLVESDVNHEFCHRLFKELVKWHRKVGWEGVGGWAGKEAEGGGWSWKLFFFSCSSGGVDALTDWLGALSMIIFVELSAMRRKRKTFIFSPF